MGGELRGLRALVTGASKGIGYAVATRLQDEGGLGDQVSNGASSALRLLASALQFRLAFVHAINSRERPPVRQWGRANHGSEVLAHH